MSNKNEDLIAETARYDIRRKWEVDVENWMQEMTIKVDDLRAEVNLLKSRGYNCWDDGK